MININSILSNGHKILSESLIKTAKLDAEILLSTALNRDLKEIILDNTIILNENQINIYKDLINRRKSGEPIAYILNKKEFWKHNFYVNQNVLIPRPDTEVIVEETIKLLNRNKNKFANNNFQIVKKKSIAYLRNVKENYDLIFADPPYGKENYLDLMNICIERLANNGKLVLEMRNNDFSFTEAIIKNYGDTKIIFFTKK